MEDRKKWWLLLPQQLRNLPADLAITATVTLLATAAATVPLVNETPLRVVLGLPYVLFVPGYAFIAALFPEASDEQPDSDDTNNEDTATGYSDTGGISGIERVALSFGLSIAIVPLIGLVLNFTPWGIRLGPILVSISGFTLLMVAVAAHRRWELPEEDQFEVPYRSWVRAARSELLEPESRTDAALNVVLALSIILAVASVGYAVAVPKQGEAFTELYLLTHDGEPMDSQSELVAAGYPTEFTLGEGKSIVVGIGNHEHQRVRYEVIVELQRVTFVNNSTNVLEQRRLDRFATTLAANETWRDTRTIRPTMTGTRLRLAFLLYKGSAPTDPTVTGAYREVHLWINVSR